MAIRMPITITPISEASSRQLCTGFGLWISLCASASASLTGGTDSGADGDAGSASVIGAPQESLRARYREGGQGQRDGSGFRAAAVHAWITVTAYLLSIPKSRYSILTPSRPR